LPIPLQGLMRIAEGLLSPASSGATEGDHG